MKVSLIIDDKAFNGSLNQLNEKMKIIMIFVQAAISDVAKQLIRGAQKFNEETQKMKIMELKGLNTFPSMMSLEEYVESLKEKQDLKYKESILPRPIKSTGATKVNNKKSKIIYFHIRSNC